MKSGTTRLNLQGSSVLSRPDFPGPLLIILTFPALSSSFPPSLLLLRLQLQLQLVQLPVSRITSLTWKCLFVRGAPRQHQDVKSTGFPSFYVTGYLKPHYFNCTSKSLPQPPSSIITAYPISPASDIPIQRRRRCLLLLLASQSRSAAPNTVTAPTTAAERAQDGEQSQHL